MNWLRRLFGGNAREAGQKPHGLERASASSPTPMATEDLAGEGSSFEPAPDQALQATFEVRDAYWSEVGTPETDVIAYLVSPQFMGAPAWPTTRQSFRVVRTPTSTILATDGMADPFDGVENGPNGFEAELFIETGDIPAEVGGRPGEVDPIKLSWAFVILEQVGRLIADVGGIASELDARDVISAELPGAGEDKRIADQVPGRFLTEDRTVGLLLGLRAEGRPSRIEDAPLSPIRLVAITLLTERELEYVRTGPLDARLDLAQRLAARPNGHFSDLKRESVI